jgi:hypothetical protein
MSLQIKIPKNSKIIDVNQTSLNQYYTEEQIIEIINFNFNSQRTTSKSDIDLTNSLNSLSSAFSNNDDFLI